ncbi:GDP dissociation inhibitor-domain-containing protein [Crassisporium funariophilum]|nr:GDP dissociation inhibitor-domain-containing protein [Crassisporium funariophilum]
MDESSFDVIVLGTGLVESIVAAALSKAGYRVAHIDENAHYGGHEGSLSLEEFVQWLDTAAVPLQPTSHLRRVSRSKNVPTQSRQYSICLKPSVIPSMGPLISSLVSSGVAKYSGFRLLDSVSFYDSSGHVKSVPGSKEDIFKSKEISLIEKRRLMRFLTFAAGDFEDKKELEGNQDLPFLKFLQTVFSLSEHISSVISYSLAFCMSDVEPTLPTLRRLRTYLRSAGRYGPSPFLIGHYGGIGDIAQGFCRAAAVSGGVYILGRQIKTITRCPTSTRPIQDDCVPTLDGKPSFNYKLCLEDFPDVLSCNLIISSSSYVPPELKGEAYHLPRPMPDRPSSGAATIARCVAIIDRALSLQSRNSDTETIGSSGNDGEGEAKPSQALGTGLDTGVLVFAPSSVAGGSTSVAATALITGEGSLSTPKGKWLVYIGLPILSELESLDSPESLLTPYLDALLSLSLDPAESPIQPLFTSFYLDIPTDAPPSASAPAEASMASPTYLVPAPLQITPFPDLPDDAARIAESTFMEAVKILQSQGHLGNLRIDEDGMNSDVVFWPPLPVDEEAEDSD